MGEGGSGKERSLSYSIFFDDLVIFDDLNSYISMFSYN